MKTLFKNLTTGTLALLIVAGPLTTFAAEDRERTGLFCGRIDELTTKIDARFDAVTGKIAAIKGERISKFEAKRDTRDAARAEKRSAVDAKREAGYDALKEKADTEAKKTAVETFERKTEAAIAVRQQAVDSAVATFRSGITTLVTTKMPGLDSNVATLQSAVDAAISQAKSDCAAGKESTVVRETLMTDLKAAQADFRDNRTDVQIQSEIQTLTANRAKAVSAAMTTFTAEMEKNKAELKAAFAR